MQILCPDLLSQDTQKVLSEQRIAIINEVMQVFRWTSPFTTDKLVPIDSVFEDLLQKSLFRDYDNLIKLFNRRAKPGKYVWRTEDVYRPLQSVMKACGVEIESTVIGRTRKNGQDVQKYAYSIQADAALGLARLVNLKLRKIAADLSDEIRQYLAAAGFGPSDRLLDIRTRA